MELAEVAPFNKLLGLKVHQRSPERSEAELTVREERRGVLHGGAVMALGDTLGGMTASSSLPAGGRTATIESRQTFLQLSTWATQRARYAFHCIAAERLWFWRPGSRAAMESLQLLSPRRSCSSSKKNNGASRHHMCMRAA